FFSSRRRHTRSKRDWSSDVCSSDLAGLASTEHIKKWETVYEPFYHWVSELLNNAKEKGTIRETINVKPTSKLLIGLIESAAEQVYLYVTNKEDQAKMQKSEVNAFLKNALGVQD